MIWNEPCKAKQKIYPNKDFSSENFHKRKQARYDKAEPLLLKPLESRHLKLGDIHPHTLESWNNLINLYEAQKKPEKANEWQAKLVQIEDFEE